MTVQVSPEVLLHNTLWTMFSPLCQVSLFNNVDYTAGPKFIHGYLQGLSGCLLHMTTYGLPWKPNLSPKEIIALFPGNLASVGISPGCRSPAAYLESACVSGRCLALCLIGSAFTRDLSFSIISWRKWWQNKLWQGSDKFSVILTYVHEGLLLTELSLDSAEANI